MSTKISLDVYQYDGIDSFAAYAQPLEANNKPFIAINIEAVLESVVVGDLTPEDLPYMIAECIMHEVVHGLEDYFKVEFSEEKVEQLIAKYRETGAKQDGL
jgi:hypothetical protein